MEEKITINERLKKLVLYLVSIKRVYNQKDFADRIGKSKSQISEMLKGTLAVSERTVHMIADAFPEINPTWLLTGEGEMLKPAKNNFTQFTQEEIGDIITEKVTAQLMRMYSEGEIYPSVAVDRMLMEKDNEIERLKAENRKLLEENITLKANLKD